MTDRYGVALAMLMRAAKRETDDEIKCVLFTLLADCHYGLEEYDEMEAAAKQALAADPQDVNLLRKDNELRVRVARARKSMMKTAQGRQKEGNFVWSDLLAGREVPMQSMSIRPWRESGRAADGS